MAKSSPVNGNEFAALMAAILPGYQINKIAVAVSGGADSMALTLLLADWAASRDIQIHALTVDHKLRAASTVEAKQVATWLKPFKNIIHETLIWKGPKPKTKISEVARAKRYALLLDYCHQHKIEYLFLAHHLDDQAETFLLRLSGGSGLDGLSGMWPVQPRDGVNIMRPLLSIPHDRLIATLKSRRQKWIEDPTNTNTDYARPRLRAAARVLSAEGLTPARLATTAARLARGRAALEQWADQLWASVECNKAGLQIARSYWDNWPDEIRVRILTRGLQAMNGKTPPARMEQIERVIEYLQQPSPKTCRVTIGGCIVTRGEKFIRIVVESRSK